MLTVDGTTGYRSINTVRTGQSEYLRSLLNCRVSSCALRLPDSILLSVSSFLTDFGSWTFTISEPRVLKSLAHDIRCNTSTITFRHHLDALNFNFFTLSLQFPASGSVCRAFDSAS